MASQPTQPPETKLRRFLRVFTRPGWKHWARFALLLIAGTWVGRWLEESERFEDIRDAVYQAQIRMQRHGEFYPQHTVLVLLDDDDFWTERYASREPLKRDQLALLMDKLNQAGANIVALDIDLRSPLASKPDFDFAEYVQEDRALMDAAERMCAAGRHVVFATSVRYAGEDELHYVEKPSVYTNDLPHLPCARTGYIQFPEDSRLIPGRLDLAPQGTLDSFALAILHTADPIAYRNAVKGSDSERTFRFGQYLTDADYSPKDGQQFIFNGRAVMSMDAVALRQAVADKIVILGEHWHRYAYGQGKPVDQWPSPAGMEPGAMLHANYVESLMDRTGTFAPISGGFVRGLEWAMAMGLAILSILQVHAGWKWGGFAMGILLSVLLSYVLLQNAGMFLDFFVPLLMIIAHTVSEEILELKHHLHHLRHQVKHLQSQVPATASGQPQDALPAGDETR